MAVPLRTHPGYDNPIDDHDGYQCEVSVHLPDKEKDHDREQDNNC